MKYSPWVRGDVNPTDWADIVPPDINREDLLTFADDSCGNYYCYVLTKIASHRVIYMCHDPFGAQLRYSSLATFLDAQLVWGYASAWHRKVEIEGPYIDDKPWMDAARALEAQIDPSVVRT